MTKINLIKLDAANSSMDKNGIAAINELAASLKIILEQGGSMRKAVTTLFEKGLVKVEVKDGEPKLVKLEECKGAKRLILAELGKTGLFDFDQATEDWNTDRDELSKARLDNLRRFQSCEANIRRAIDDVRGETKKSGGKVTVDTAVKKVVNALGKAAKTKKAKKKFLDGVIAALEEVRDDL